MKTIIVTICNATWATAMMIAVRVIFGNLVMQQEIWAVLMICVVLSGAGYHILTKEVRGNDR